MEQYKFKYPEFKFLEAVPMDFADLDYYYGFKKKNLLDLIQEGYFKNWSYI